MRKFAAAAVLCGLVLALVAGVVCAQRLWAQAGTVKRKPPPKAFDKRVEDAFLKDVVKQHGEGTINDVLAGRGAPKPSGGGNDPVPTPGGGNGNSGWSKVISAETLESEIKSAVNAVGPLVDSPPKWKTGHRKVRVIYSTLAACFGVIAQYDGDVRFKKDAIAMRDGLARSAANAKTDSQQTMNEAKKWLGELQQLRNGGSVAAPSGEPGKPYGVTELSVVMKRMENATSHKDDPTYGIDRWLADAASLKSKKSEVIHEAEILGMLAKVLQHSESFENFDFVREPEFVKYAKAIETATQDVVAAAKSDNYANARAAAGKITTACSGCHDRFKK